MTKKIAYYIYMAAVVLLLAWIGLSWFDIVMDNCNVAPVHNNYNFFNVLEVFKK